MTTGHPAVEGRQSGLLPGQGSEGGAGVGGEVIPTSNVFPEKTYTYTSPTRVTEIEKGLLVFTGRL